MRVILEIVTIAELIIFVGIHPTQKHVIIFVATNIIGVNRLRDTAAGVGVLVVGNAKLILSMERSSGTRVTMYLPVAKGVQCQSMAHAPQLTIIVPLDRLERQGRMLINMPGGAMVAVAEATHIARK